jgi:hypothetical protein
LREPYPPHVRWHKSSHSSASGQCVEVAPVAGAVAVRDSRNPAGPGLVFTRPAWVAFVEGLKGGGAAGARAWAGRPDQERG